MIRKLTALAVCAGSMLVGTSAFAQSAPPDMAARVGWSAAALVGYGTNNLNFGIGARVGYTLPSMPIYIGATLMYHFGESQDDGFGDSVGVHFLIPGIEGGYELAAGPVIVRPYLGLGIVDEIVSFSGPNSAGAGAYGGGSSTDFGFWFGATGLYPITPQIDLGVDLRVLLVSGYNSFIPDLTAAYHF